MSVVVRVRSDKPGAINIRKNRLPPPRAIFKDGKVRRVKRLCRRKLILASALPLSRPSFIVTLYLSAARITLRSSHSASTLLSPLRWLRRRRRRRRLRSGIGTMQTIRTAASILWHGYKWFGLSPAGCVLPSLLHLHCYTFPNTPSLLHLQSSAPS